MTPCLDTVIVNGLVLTQDSRATVFANGFVAIDGNRIAAVGGMADAGRLPPARETVDAGGRLVMPGLVNSHTHLPMSLFRGLADDLPLDRWLNDYIFPAEARCIDAESVRIGSLLSCAELLLSGTTTCCDGYFYEDQVAAAVLESGLRGVLGQGVVDFPAPGVPDPEDNVAAAADFVRRWQGRHRRILPSIFCHSPYTCGSETLKRAKAAADRAGVLFQIHVAESRQEAERLQSEQGAGPVAYLDRLGILDRRTLLVHAVWTGETDHACIAARKSAVAHCPESNAKLASGVAPLASLLSAGVTVGLGTDGCASNNDLDLWREMGFAAKLQKVALDDPTVVDAATAVNLAVGGGARALGLAGVVGALETGLAADVIIVDTHQPHLTPMYHPQSHLVHAARGADVSDVWVDGRRVVAGRRLLTIDLTALTAAVAVAKRRIVDSLAGA